MKQNGFKIIKSKPIKEMVYDLEVEGNHNFFVNNVLVHNCIADIVVSLGKKKYACRILDNEGVRLTKPKKKIIGLEIKRSDTPQFVRDKLENVLDFIFEEDNMGLVKFIQETKEEYMKLPAIDFGIPKGVTDIDKWIGVTKGVPQHVKGAINHNKIVEDGNMLSDFPKIVNGDKLKMLLMKPVNKLDVKVLSFQSQKLIENLDLMKDVDKDFMFERSFMSPVKGITDKIGWKTEDKVEACELF